MRLRQVIFTLALAVTMQVSAAQPIFGSIDETGEPPALARPTEFITETVSAEPTEAERARISPPVTLSPVAIPTPLLSEFRNERHADTYRDVYQILKEDNVCSRFFGGPVQAAEVLNRLAERLKPSLMVNNMVAIKMGGAYMQVQNRRTGASYRLFEQVLVNSEGPFSRAPIENAAQRQTIGQFRLHTRAARALILLHELGHLVQGTDGHWLLPNDGHNEQLSLRNTRTVESHCLKQLATLNSINE